MNRTRLAIAVVIVVMIILFMFLACGFLLGRLLSAPATRRSANTSTLITQVQGLAQLVTVKYTLEKVVVLEDYKIYGENRVILVAHGTVKAGVDLTKLRPGDVTIQGRSATLRLPWATITDVYLDEAQTEVVEQSTGLLRRFDKGLQQDARREALDTIRRNARYTGIVDEANVRARELLTHFLEPLGFDTVQFK